MLDADARKVWRLIDGRRSVGRIVEDLAKESGLPAAEIEQPVHALFGRLLELDILEVATPADIAALAQSAFTG